MRLSLKCTYWKYVNLATPQGLQIPFLASKVSDCPSKLVTICANHINVVAYHLESQFGLGAKLSEPRKAMKAPCTSKRSRSSQPVHLESRISIQTHPHLSQLKDFQVSTARGFHASGVLWGRCFLVIVGTGGDDKKLNQYLHKSNTQAHQPGRDKPKFKVASVGDDRKPKFSSFQGKNWSKTVLRPVEISECLLLNLFVFCRSVTFPRPNPFAKPRCVASWYVSVKRMKEHTARNSRRPRKR